MTDITTAAEESCAPRRSKVNRGEPKSLSLTLLEEWDRKLRAGTAKEQSYKRGPATISLAEGTWRGGDALSVTIREPGKIAEVKLVMENRQVSFGRETHPNNIMVLQMLRNLPEFYRSILEPE
jgi:hypothetical protein